MTIHLSVVTVWAEDVKTTAHFHRDAIGLEPVPHHGGGPTFRLDRTYLTIKQGRPVPAQDPVPDRFPLVAFAVPDLDRAVDQLKEFEVELLWGIEHNESSRWVMFHDPAGNLIELAEFHAGQNHGRRK